MAYQIQIIYSMKSEPKGEEAVPQKRNPKEGRMQEIVGRIVAWRRESAEQQWQKKSKSEEDREKEGSLKTKYRKLKNSGKPKSHMKWSIKSTT